MGRDDFSQATINLLTRRVASRCSNQACRCITTGPHTDPNKAMNVGVAAHITAASVGGPRYDASITPAERRDAANGIWLCQRCAKLVDNDEVRYPKDMLLQWRSEAEEAARVELETGQPPVIDQTNIQFSVDNWTIWRERGNLPGDSIVFITGWGRGDLRFGCNVRLRSIHHDEEQLHNLRLQYRAQTDILFEDEYAFSSDVVLPPRKWQTLGLDHGLHRSRESTYSLADSLWFAAELVGSPRTFAWKVVDFDHTNQISIPVW